MKKKGVSELLATILVVVFVIAIALSVFSCVKKTATQETEKSSDKMAAQEVCRDNVKIRVNKVTSDGDKLRIEVENLKKQVVTDFVVRAEQGSNLDVSKVRQLLNGYEKTTLTIDQKFSPSSVKVIPQITLKRPDIKSVVEGWWLCSDQMAVYSM